MYRKEDDLPSAVALNYHVYSMTGVQILPLQSNWSENLPFTTIYTFMKMSIDEAIAKKQVIRYNQMREDTRAYALQLGTYQEDLRNICKTIHRQRRPLQLLHSAAR